MLYEEAMSLLEGYINYERVSKYLESSENLGTERMVKLLQLLGNPQRNFVAFHIAGTKGKGSTAHLTAAIVKKMGLKVGLFTSPHIVELRERIQINGNFISKEYFAHCFSIIHNIAKDLGDDDRPTYFEMLTAIAFLAFSNEPIDIAVLEVGLGGRLDATNVPSLAVVVSAITPISHDHSAMLGETLEEIAGEKAGIIRHNTPVVIGKQEDNVMAVVAAKASDNVCKTVRLGIDISVECVEHDYTRLKSQTITIKTSRAVYENITLPLLGEHQVDNAGMAVGIIEEFLESAVQPAIMRDAWENMVIPGRVEIVSSIPWILLDSSHNPASVWALSECVEKYFPQVRPKILVFSACADKDAKAMLRILIPLFDSVVFTTNNSERHIKPNKLAEMALELYPNLKQDVKDSPLSAVDLAMHIAGDKGLVVVCGSMYLIGDIRDFCKTVGQFIDYSNE